MTPYQRYASKREKDNQGLYVLKHKDLDVALVHMDIFSGTIEYVIEVFLPDELPIGCDMDGNHLKEWWKSRAIPDTRRGIQQVLQYLDGMTSQALMLDSYGLSLTDHYWLQPVFKELYWKDINFYDHDFSDELGNLLTGSGKIDADRQLSHFSPSSSVNGEMKKKWVLEDGKRFLLKVNTSDYGQQSVNEVIACKMHEKIGWENYVPYSIATIRSEGEDTTCSLSPLFTSDELEFVSAYQLIQNYKIPNDLSEYEAIIQQAAIRGLDEGQVRRQLEYTILTDFIVTNTDRHYNNFGFLYDPKQHKLTAMAPLFDTGNSLFYNREFIPLQSNLLDIRVTSFCKREVEMLKYVHSPEQFSLSALTGLPDMAKELLLEYTNMPIERAERISQTITEKLEYLKHFLKGAKIWKKENFW